MSSTRTAPRANTSASSSSATTTNLTKTTSNTHHTNGSANSYDNTNDSTVPSNNTSEFDSNLQRSVLMKNFSQSDGVYRNPRFIHAATVGLVGQPVVIQTSEQERLHGVLETLSPTGDVLLSVAHRLDTNNNDIIGLSTSLIDLFDTVDSSLQSFELQKRVIPSSNIVEIIAVDVDLSGNGKCVLDENPKANQLEDDRFNRMEHFYGADDIDPETLEDLDRGDDGKAGYDPEDMFHTNREKFNTTTDFDESKYTNVPLRQMTADELAEIDKKVSEIEKGTRNIDIDEDDAGVKRPSENNQTHNNDEGNNSNKNNQSSRFHQGDRRPDSRYDAEYNPSKRGNWRDQRAGGGNNRRGGPNNYPMNNPKQNPRSDQAQYTTSRSSEQSTNNRQQPYKSRNNRFPENRSPHEGRDSPLQTANDETTRGQRMNSGSFSQGPNSGPTSPSTSAPARSNYPPNNRPPIGRNSPAPYTGSSSSRNNSTTATSSPPASSSSTTSYQTNPTTTGNYSQQSNNKMTKKQPRNDQQSTIDDSDQPKQQQQQRNQQQSSSNNQSNPVSLNRPSQLHTQQAKQQPQQQQTAPSANNVPPLLTLPSQEDHASSHEPVNSNQSDPTMHLTNPTVYSQHTTGAMLPGNSAKGNLGLNPEADEFVPVFSRESSSRPDSRGASTGAIPMNNTFIPHPHPQALHLLQQQHQQQAQQQQQSMIPQTHPQNTPAIYQQYYQSSFANMQQYGNPTAQQVSVNMMGTPMMVQQQQQLTGNGPNANNPNSAGTGGMTTPNGGSGPTYKANNPAHGADTGNSSVNNVASKKAVVSVQRTEQPNVSQQQQQQQQVAGASQMVYPAPPMRYYPTDYMTQQTTTSPMQLQQIPFYYPINTSSLIQAATAANVGPPQNIMIPSGNSSAGPSTPAPTSMYYPGLYPDPRMYTVYPSPAPVNPGGGTPNWQLARSPPHQQQQQQPTADQQRAYGGGQNIVAQSVPPTGVPNTGGGGGGRSASTSGPSGQTGGGGNGPPMTPQYALNGNMPTAYTYGPSAAWFTAQSQVPSPQTSMPPQINAYGMMFDPSQQAQSQQQAYMHPNPYETAYFQPAQQQQQSQQPPQ